MRLLILIMLLPLWGCDQTASEAGKTEETADSYAQRFLADFQSNLVAEGVSEQDAEKLAAAAGDKINSLALVNVDSNDADRVSDLGLQGALFVADELGLDDMNAVLYAAIDSRLKENDPDVLSSVENLTRYYAANRGKDENLGSALVRMQNTVGEKYEEYPSGQMVKIFVASLKEASYDFSTKPELFFYEAIENISKSYTKSKYSSQDNREEDAPDIDMQAFLDALPDLIDFNEESFKYSTIVSRLGRGVKSAVKLDSTDRSDELKKFKKSFLARSQKGLQKIYGDGTESMEFATEMEDEFSETFDAQ